MDEETALESEIFLDVREFEARTGRRVVKVELRRLGGALSVEVEAELSERSGTESMGSAEEGADVEQEIVLRSAEEEVREVLRAELESKQRLSAAKKDLEEVVRLAVMVFEAQTGLSVVRLELCPRKGTEAWPVPDLEAVKARVELR